MQSVDYAMITHHGRLRPHNEDSIAAGSWIGTGTMLNPRCGTEKSNWPLLLMVADGVGGHAGGEVASRLAAEYLISHDFADTDDFNLPSVLVQTSQRIIGQAHQAPSLWGMATTVVGLLVHPDRMVWFNVGDSRAYSIVENGILQLSVDDVPDRDREWGRSHIITQVLGNSFSTEEICPHVGTIQSDHESRFLLCSDGLTDMLGDAEIASAIQDTNNETVRVLLERALAAGGHDNVSIVAATIA